MIKWSVTLDIRRLHDGRRGLGTAPVEGYGDHAGGSMEIEHIDEETISYHALFTLDVIV
jgi:hypothetical protein